MVPTGGDYNGTGELLGVSGVSPVLHPQAREAPAVGDEHHLPPISMYRRTNGGRLCLPHSSQITFNDLN
jgi:hypothetical protein